MGWPGRTPSLAGEAEHPFAHDVLVHLGGAAGDGERRRRHEILSPVAAQGRRPQEVGAHGIDHPGVADPGQILIAAAQQLNATVKPLVGPSSILLALMASGMNGQQFEFTGYLPIDNAERIKRIKELELSSQKNNSTKIFIETPYRNNQLIETILKTCKPITRFCIAAELTAPTEFVQTKTIAQWQQQKTDFHKKPVIFLLQG